MLLPGGGVGRRAELPPTVRAVVSARLDALPHACASWHAAPRCSSSSFDLRRAPRRSTPTRPRAEIEELIEAEIVVPDTGAGPPHWRLRHSTLKDVAYASLPKRERARLHAILADRLLAEDHPSWAAEHLERPRPPRSTWTPTTARSRTEPPTRCSGRATGRAAAWRAVRRSTTTSGPSTWPATRGRVGRPGGARAGGHGRGPLLARRVPGRHRGPAAGGRARRGARRRVHARPRPAVPRRHRDQRRRRPRRRRGVARPFARGRRAARRPVGDRAHAPVRRVGALDPPPATRTPRSIWQRALATAESDDGWARVRALNSLSINRTGGPGEDTETSSTRRSR